MVKPGARQMARRQSSVQLRARRGIKYQREPAALPANALGVELHVRRILFERLQDQRAELARRRPFLTFAKTDAVIGDNHRDVAAFQLADQFDLTAGTAD